MKLKHLLVALTLFTTNMLYAQLEYFGATPDLHVEGKWLVDPSGNQVVLHGVMDTPSPYFNNNRWGWSCNDGSVSSCINYFNKLFTAITDTQQGSYCNLFRLHLDPCWTNDNNVHYCDKTGDGEANIEHFSQARLEKYLNSLYMPIAENALKHGLYVIIRPPGVFPGSVSVNGVYHNYLKTVWNIVSKNETLKKYEGKISLELGNEPVTVLDANGRDSNNSLHDFFQPIVDIIRDNGYNGVLWAPGTGWQANYTKYKSVPLNDPKKNLGFAVHDYPGWYNTSDQSYDYNRCINQFRNQVPVVDTHPIVITEVDWSPEKSGTGHTNEHGQWVTGNFGTWATATTSKWGNCFKNMVNNFGNISFTLQGTGVYLDIDTYINSGKVQPAFINDMKSKGFADAYEACSGACFIWYKEFANSKLPHPDGTVIGSKIVSGGKGDVHISAVDFKSWNGTDRNATSTGVLSNNYGGGARVEGGALLYGDNEVSNLKYADLTGCTKLIIQGTSGMTVRALFNRQTATGSDYVEKSGDITNGKFEINLNEVSSSYVHLNAIKTGWGSTPGTVENIYVTDPNTPIDYYLSGSGNLDESALNALADPNAKNINVCGLNNEEAITLNPANLNCLIYTNNTNKLKDTRNVVLKNGNSYTATNITLSNGGPSNDVAEVGYDWASTSGNAQWRNNGNGTYSFSWSASNDAVELFHNLAGKTQTYLVVKTTEFTNPWGVRFSDNNGNLIAEQEYWVGQASNNMIKEINIDSLFAKKNVSHLRQSLKTVSLYAVGASGRVTLNSMYLVTGGSTSYYPFFAPYNISANNATCSINVNTFTPTWIPFESSIPSGYEAYDVINTSNGNVINKVSRVYANKPVLLNGNGTAEFKASNVYIPATSNITNGALVGVADRTQPESGSYVFAKVNGSVAFKEVGYNDGSFVNPLHAYMTKGANSSVVKAMGQIVQAGSANAIEQKVADKPNAVEYYNAAGIRINALQKGINIIKMSDGTIKKVLVK